MRKKLKIRKTITSISRQMMLAGLLPSLTYSVSAQTKPKAEQPDSSNSVTDYLDALVVTGETDADRKIQAAFLPDVVGNYIYAGKKTSVMDFDELPQINTDNYRQAFAKTPGLLTSEVSNASLLSLSYRGIGDPHESQNLMVLKNGIPFVLDPLGYSTVYFAPPFESLDRLEFVSGGAALLFGSQPSGALNYITHLPDRSSLFNGSTQHIVGSDNLYSTFSTFQGGNEKFGYILNYDHRSGDSFRSRNSDFELDGVDLSLYYDISATQRVTATFERYQSDHGEPGGRSLTNYRTNRNQNMLNFDRVRLDRTFGSIGYELGDENANWKTQVWASDVVRYSKRESDQGFGVFTQPNQALRRLNINQHDYNTVGLDSRMLLNYDLAGNENTFTFGVTAMDIHAPIFVERTALGDFTSDRNRLDVRNKSVRDSQIVGLFAENLFRFGRFTVTPSFRLEYNRQSIDETVNSSKIPANFLDETRDEFVPLGGLGVTYDVTKETEFYGNVSSAYKPPTYTDAFPLGGADTFSENLDAGDVIQMEAGYRGRPTEWSSVDVSVFRIDYDNRFGRVGNNFQNVGRSINQGLSFAGEIDLYDLVNGKSDFDVSLYCSYQLLDAEFTDGPLNGFVPQYAPDNMLRTGIIVREAQDWKVAAMLTHLSDHFANDNNTANNEIPAYMVVDLTAEVKVWSDTVGGVNAEIWALCGINNLFNEDYFSRVRSNGIDPANERNYYIGLRAEF